MLKVIIADDEAKARSLILHLGKWMELGLEVVGEAEDGDQLYEMAVELAPDLVITDMKMPGLSGADLIRMLHELRDDMKLIIISGFDDFVFAKQAISSKAVDYILKPIDEDELDAALRKSVQEIRHERAKRIETLSLSLKAHEAEAQSRMRTLNKVIQGLNIGKEEWDAVLGQIGITEQFSYQVVVLKINKFHWLLARYGADTYLLHYALSNIINELIPANRMTAFSNESERNEFILLIFRPISEAELQKVMHSINKNLFELLTIVMLSGVGEPRRMIEQIPESLETARAAFLRLPIVHDCHNDQGALAGSKTNELPPIALFSELKTVVELDDTDEIAQIIADLLTGAIRNPDGRISDLRALNQQILPALEPLRTHADETHAVSLGLERLAQDLLDEFDAETIVTLYRQFLSAISPLLASRRRKREKSAIYSIRNYIEENYMSKLSLAELSSKFYVSEEHISRAFKEEFDINLFDYILRLRIERAKALIVENKMKVSEVVELLGFVDASHFTKTFKKLTGITPSEYRDRMKAASHQLDTNKH